jgi:hypothetical protein
MDRRAAQARHGAAPASDRDGFEQPPAAFQSPSGNVHCRYAAPLLRCEVLARAFPAPPPPADCAARWGDSFGLRAAGEPTLLCPADSIRDDEAFVLGYGARWIGPGIACLSDESGMRCSNGAGHGFLLSRTRFDRF